ncbi:MAG: hypothetical protein OXG46_09280 [Chloroflexi bacterium]|nr:hypothetical protein [Chloroflexota bacterium]MCY3938420.1 hypothetical protein [Chloroflexota bacterium]
MDTMDRYKIHESIKDVISILDCSPIRPDLVAETIIVQLTNRAPIAHLAIERGIKVLINEAGGSAENEHGLHRLYRALRECDEKSAEYLATAFDDAVGFFRYNVNKRGFKQFRSFDDYLTKAGTDRAFEALRYWAIGESSKGASPISHISLAIHRELLRAVWCLFFPSRRETVSSRVEGEIANAMFYRREIYWSPDDISMKQSVDWYWNWLFKEHRTRRSALEEAVDRQFIIKDNDEFVRKTLRDAYADLQQSKDPAVRYFLGTLTYLPKGSQRRIPDAIPEVEWFDDVNTRGLVVTPGGTELGLIERYADGGWGIMPAREGLAQQVAEVQADAKAYLVGHLTKPVRVTVDGESKRLRIVTDGDRFPAPVGTSDHVWTTDADISSLSFDIPTYKLEFWDANHDLSSGVAVSVELEADGGRRFVSILQGEITAVEKHEVSITGMTTVARSSTSES